MDVIEEYIRRHPEGACREAHPTQDTVYKDECVYTFHSPYTLETGIVIHLHSLVGTIPSLAFAATSFEEGLFLRIVKQRIPKELPTSEEDVSTVPTKLALGVEGGFASEDDLYETKSTYSVVLLKKTSSTVVEVAAEVPYVAETKASLPLVVSNSVESIIHHVGSAVQQATTSTFELDTDDQAVPISKYAESLPFVDNGVSVNAADPSTWHCRKDPSITTNLWLNLSTGYIGSGRQHWDGSGGANGALDHFNDTGRLYPLVVKLGTIVYSPSDGSTSADCYSYAPDEDGPVKIPNLPELLLQRGIDVTKL
jgi:ubiquitin carboxyl-terminal hydrolase 5/13